MTVDQLTSCLTGKWIICRRKRVGVNGCTGSKQRYFAASEPVHREMLARIVGKSCSNDLLIDDIREELRGRPYNLVAVAGGWKHLTRPAYADAIRAAVGESGKTADLTQFEVLVLMFISYFQPITRAELSSFFGKEVSRDFMERELRDRRASSKLSDLVEFVLSRPLVSAGMIQERLKVTKQGALNQVGELGLREMTGRGRFRAWGIV